METEDVQIKRSYEVLKMSPEQIAEDRQLSIVAVKAKLMQVSHTYRQDCKAEPENEAALNFTAEEHKEAMRTMVEVMRCAETADGFIDWKTRGQMAIQIRDDVKGRKDVAKGFAGNNFNVLQFNTMFQQARAKASDALKQITQTQETQNA